MEGSAEAVPAAETFPGIGRRYLAAFPAFRFELHFESPISATWTQLLDDGSRGRSETEAIHIEPIGHSIFIVTWQERNGTTVVSVEDFARQAVVTHITRADQSFLRARGTLIELA